jgi:hypothetical protein
MTIIELKEALRERGVSDSDYSLEGGLPNETHCISKINNFWEVYYSERGHKSCYKKFKTESEACEYFYNWLVCVLEQMKLI